MVDVEAPIERIELFEDRASVTRRVPLPGPGRHTLRIDRVSPLAPDRGLVFPGDAGGIVEEANVQRRLVTREQADEAVSRQLASREFELNTDLSEAEDASRRAKEHAERVRARVDVAFAWTPLALLADTAPAWVDAVVQADEALATALQAATDADSALQALREERDDVQRRLAASRSGSQVWRAAIVLRLIVPDPAPAELRVRYTVPCAAWRPIHRATLRPLAAGQRVAWEIGAMVWNATGEDWHDVQLVCSTARPGGHATPPVLLDDWITAQPKNKEVIVEAREESIAVAREGEIRRTEEAMGVDDGGEPRTFTAPHPVQVLSDGRPVHVHLEGWETDATVAWVAHPERSAQVVLRSRQNNAGMRPLLAGPVDLFREDATHGRGAVGRGRIDLVGPGEPFAIGWGSHDGARVTRKSETKVDRSRFTGHQSWQFQVTLKVANLSKEAVAVELRERVPVSELVDVKVSAPVASPPCEPVDGDGRVTWRLTLAPTSTRTVTLSYTVDAPSSVRLPWSG